MPVGTYTWQWQEMLKGRGGSDTWIGSTHGGWSFAVNTNYYLPDPVNGVEMSILGSPYYYSHMTAAQASPVPNSQLQTNAFFDFSSGYVQNCINIYSSDTADLALLGSGGSAYAAANRARILSDAIPALTLPTGANKIPILSPPSNPVERNFDLTSTAFQNGWPVARLANIQENNNWHHSDFDYVAYPFTHKLFDAIINNGNLK